MTDVALENITTRLSALVRQVADEGFCTQEINADTRFVEDVGMESINRLMLMTLVESELGVSLEDHMSTLVGLNTVGETARFVHSLETRGPA